MPDPVTILVITTEPLPLPGGLTTGAGLRAWGLAEGLRSKGLSVTIATPLEGEQAFKYAEDPSLPAHIRFFRRPQLSQLIDKVNPSVIIMQHWGLVYALPALERPLVIDLAGPHLLEREFWGSNDLAADRGEKLKALSRADFVTVGGYVQRDYFLPLLKEAGWILTEGVAPVIPFSVPPEQVAGQPAPGAEATFIYGGAFLGWQNPERPIRWLLDEMDSAGKGRLLFYGGAHPSMDASAGKFVELYRLLQSHPRVELRGWKPFAELEQEYAAEGHVALDLMERNRERELAYTTRTMVYLHCGLPVIYNNYSELSEVITKTKSGWCLDPEDEAGFRALAKSVILDPAIALRLKPNALAAARAQSWDKTIGPLADYCKSPVCRVGAKKELAGHSVQNQEVTSDKLVLNRNFSLRPGKYIGILVYIPVWLVCKYLSFLFNVSPLPRAHKK